MTNSNDCQLRGNSNGGFEAMWAEIVRLDFFNIYKFHSKKQNLKFKKKMNNGLI